MKSVYFRSYSSFQKYADSSVHVACSTGNHVLGSNSWWIVKIETDTLICSD